MLDAKELAPLKKLLEYDPYLDFNLVPKLPKEWEDEKYLQSHPELAEEIAAKKKLVSESLRKLREDKEANVIFARQDYMLKDGLAPGLDREKIYLYLNASDEFLAGAEAKLKKYMPGLARADADTEKQIIDTIDKERSSADQGLGLIFG